MKEKERFDLIQALKYLEEGKTIKHINDDKRYLKMGAYGLIECISLENEKKESWALSNISVKSNDFELYEEPKQILDTKEKAYLEAVLRPFKDRVKYVYKKNETYVIRESIRFVCDNTDFAESDECIYDLPYFEAGTMYKGLEENKWYKPEDLGLFDRKIY